MFQVNMGIFPVKIEDKEAIDGTVRLAAKMEPTGYGDAGTEEVVAMSYRFEVPTIEQALAIKSLLSGIKNSLVTIREK